MQKYIKKFVKIDGNVYMLLDNLRVFVYNCKRTINDYQPKAMQTALVQNEIEQASRSVRCVTVVHY